MSTPSNPRGLSLYANLLDPDSSAPGTISKGPVVFKNAEAAEDSAAKKPQIDPGMLNCIYPQTHE
jgi:splicing factor 45